MANARRGRSEADTPSRADDRTPTMPIVDDDAVRARAYELYEARGSEHGGDRDDWRQAERELRSTRDE